MQSQRKYKTMATTNSNPINKANTKQWQQQMRSQFITQIQNNCNGKNKCNHNLQSKYKMMATTNAITIYKANTIQWQQQMQTQFTTQIQNNGNNKYNHN